MILPHDRYGAHDIIDDVARAERSLEGTEITEVPGSMEQLPQKSTIKEQDGKGQMDADYLETTWM